MTSSPDAPESPAPAELPDPRPGPDGAAPARGRFRPEGWGPTFLLLVVAAVLGAALATLWRESGLMGGGMSVRLQQLETDLAALSAQPGGGMDTLRQSISQLRLRAEALEAAFVRQREEGQALTDLAARVQAAEASVALFSERLAAVEAAAGPGAAADSADALPPPTGDLQPFADALTRVRRDIDGLKADLLALKEADPEAAFAARFDGFEQRLAALEAIDIAGLTRRAVLALTLANLSAAAKGSAPFGEALAALAATAPDDPALAALRPIADGGAPTLAELQAQFPAVLAQALAAARGAASASWSEQAWASLSSIVVVRETGEVPGESAEAVLARAELRLAEGRLAEAVGELKALTGAPGDAAAAFVALAERRIALDAAMAELQARLLADAARTSP